MPRVGIEEELFVVDDEGRLVPESVAVLRAHRRLGPGDEIDHELFLQQVEIQTDAHLDPDALRDDLIAQRSSAVDAARAAGFHLAAVPVDVLGGSEPAPTPDSRYARMIARYGEIARNGMTCGMHIHVEVDDRDAIRVIDALRPWTPLLNALRPTRRSSRAATRPTPASAATCGTCGPPPGPSPRSATCPAIAP